jgi:hypothetical protein
MRIHAIAGAAIYLVAAAGCSGELGERPATNDPSHVAAEEAPFVRPPAYQPDPLSGGTPPKAPASPPKAPASPPAATVYTCPMHPEVRAPTAGKCPKCEMPLQPTEPRRTRP